MLDHYLLSRISEAMQESALFEFKYSGYVGSANVWQSHLKKNISILITILKIIIEVFTEFWLYFTTINNKYESGYNEATPVLFYTTR